MARYRTTLILVGLFAAAIGAVLLVQNRAPDPAPAAGFPAELRLYRFEVEDVIRLELARGGSAAVYTRSGGWTLQSDPAATPPQTVFTNTLALLGSLQAQRVISDVQATSNPAQFGLEENAGGLRVHVTLRDGKVHRFILGERLRVENSYYLKKENDIIVYTVAGAAVSNLSSLHDPKAGFPQSGGTPAAFPTPSVTTPR